MSLKLKKSPALVARPIARTERVQRISGVYQIKRSRLDVMAMGLHDLGEPLSALRLSLHALERALSTRPESSVERQLARQLDVTAARLAQLVGHLIQVCQSEGRVSPESGTGGTDLAAIAEEVCRTLLPHGGKAGKQPVALQAHFPVFGHWNELQVWQILSNLVCNAAHHGRGTPIQVSVWEEPGVGCVSVQDAGNGIAECDRDKIFDRGWRGNPKRGHGLGLWIARQLTDELGGELLVSSEVGQGARFLVKLPLHSREVNP